MSQLVPESMFKPSVPAVYDETVQVVGHPYIGFTHPLANNAAEVAGAIGPAPEGTPYLSLAGKYTKLDNPKFMYLEGSKFFVQRDNKSNAVAAKTAPPEEKGSKFKVTIEAVILAFTPAGVIPATVSFRGPKADAAAEARTAIAGAASPEFFKLSPDHQATSQIPIPFARVTAHAYRTEGTIKYGDNAGTKWQGLKAKVVPTTVGDYQELVKSMAKPEFKKMLAAAQDEYVKRVKSLQSLVK